MYIYFSNFVFVSEISEALDLLEQIEFLYTNL